jgi:hypothetical protein
MLTKRLPPVPRACVFFLRRLPEVPLRFTPGFMLTPAPQAETNLLLADGLWKD